MVLILFSSYTENNSAVWIKKKEKLITFVVIDHFDRSLLKVY